MSTAEESPPIWHAELATAKAMRSIAGGYAGGPVVSMGSLERKVFPRHHIPGGTLTAYMIRRFGWPNEGSDDHKELCAWTLTTPMEGLFLSVSPSLSGSTASGSNLHFAVRFTKKTENLLTANPIRDAYFQRLRTAVRRWWEKTGKQKYLLCCADPAKDKLILKFSENQRDKSDVRVLGLFERTSKHRTGIYSRFPRPKYQDAMICDWLADWLEKNGVRMPKWTKKLAHRSRYTTLQLQAHRALRASMMDLLHPTSISGTYINAYGDVLRDSIARIAMRRLPGDPLSNILPRFADAGNTPEYLYGPKPKTRKKKPTKRRSKA